tara:strand:+ start:3326 stop:3595 length:270 start_codon:yes stop_codon:yes gene_type:complete
MTKIYLEVSSGSELRSKIKAFVELYGYEPIVTVRDDLNDLNGDVYFGMSQDAPIVKINNKTMVVDMGSEGHDAFKFNKKTQVELRYEKI